MARIVLTVAGNVIGNLLLPGLGAAIGGAIGAYVGGMVDSQLFGDGARNNVVTGPRLHETLLNILVRVFLGHDFSYDNTLDPGWTP